MMEFPVVNVFYIHGFRSSPDSDTARRLRARFPELRALTYDYRDPAASIETLVNEIGHGEAIVVGSSLGGWYAEKVAERLLVDLVLFNPALNPAQTLARYDVEPEVLERYADLALADDVSARRRVVILSTDDDIIPSTGAEDRYRGHAEVVLTLGGHRMTDAHVPAVADAINMLEHSF